MRSPGYLGKLDCRWLRPGKRGLDRTTIKTKSSILGKGMLSN
jgi:hypothetical protein